MNISKALVRAKEILVLKGVSSGLDSLILLAHALSFSKEQVVFNPQLQLNEKQQKIFFDLVERRAKREPVSHLIGKREFFGEDFLVSRDVLDPRPDSETLIEAVLASFGKESELPSLRGGGSNDSNSAESELVSQRSILASNEISLSLSKKTLKILELGVGSGCLIITLLNSYKNSVGTAVDISEKALAVAQKNSKKHQVTQRLKLLESDLFSSLKNEEKFDLIISNPPYIPAAEIEKLEPEVRIHEPRSALDGGADGLNFYRRIAVEGGDFLTESGKIFLEIGFGQKEEIVKIFAQQKFSLMRSSFDLSGVERVLEFSSNAQSLQNPEFRDSKPASYSTK